MNTLIKNGLLVTSAGSYQGDILIENGRIAEIGKSLSPVGAEVYDAAGCEVYAGFIDAHTHLDMNTGTAQTADDFDSGTKAALAGGTTTILDFATQNKGENLSDRKSVV